VQSTIAVQCEENYVYQLGVNILALMFECEVVNDSLHILAYLC